MKISFLGNNNQENNQKANQVKYTPAYLASLNAKDTVSFSGKKTAKAVAVGSGVALLASALAGCSNPQAAADVSTADSANPISSVATENTANMFNANDDIEVVSVISTVKDKDEEVEVKKFPNALRVVGDKFKDGYQNNSTTHVVRTHTNEADQCATLREAINKQYVEPFKYNGDEIEEVTEPELHQIAREIIENNEDMQQAIASKYGVDNWMEVPAENILDDNIYEWGVNSFTTPDQVEIHGISTKSPLYDKADTKTTLYSTDAQTISLNNKIKTQEDLYSAFANIYKDAEGNNANPTAASVATWLTIKNNQYNPKFEGKINNDGDRTDLMLLDTLKDLKDDEWLELNVAQTFGVNLATSGGKSVNDISTSKAYHIVHEMSPSDTQFTLDGEKTIEDCEDTQDVYDFVDILKYYYDPDTGEKLADKVEVENEDGSKSYEFIYNSNVADLNAKAYTLFEQFAFDHLSYFAAEQNIDVDGEVQSFKYGVFDVLPGYEAVVDAAIANGDYDSAKEFLVFNRDRFVAGSFYENGKPKTGTITMTMDQYKYVDEGEGKKANVKINDDTPSEKPTEGSKTPSEKPSNDPKTPTVVPTEGPTEEPTTPSEEPTEGPTEEPTTPSEDPTTPSEEPTEGPTEEPTTPSEEPTTPSEEPTTPSEEPTEGPTDPYVPPTVNPNKPRQYDDDPTEPPTEGPTTPSEDPTTPSEDPTEPPTEEPTEGPTNPDCDDPEEPEPNVPQDNNPFSDDPVDSEYNDDPEPEVIPNIPGTSDEPDNDSNCDTPDVPAVNNSTNSGSNHDVIKQDDFSTDF